AQVLIEQEVHKAVANKERQIESIIQHIQDTNDEASFETSIQRLESRIDAIARRAEVALFHLASIQKQSSASSTANTDILGIKVEIMRFVVNFVGTAQSLTLWKPRHRRRQQIDTTRNALKNIRADNEVLTTALADLEDPPPVLTPRCSPVSKERKMGQKNQWSSNEDLCERPPCLSPCVSSEHKMIASMKTEATGSRKEDRDNENQDYFDEPMAKRLKKEASSPRHSRSLAPNDLEGMESMNNAEVFQMLHRWKTKIFLQLSSHLFDPPSLPPFLQ
ncbi:hypothetical protein CCH79_00013624, partial [Gambusia affinis]